MRTGLPPFATIEHHPVVDSIIHLSVEGFAKKLAQEVVIRRLFETELAHIVQVNTKFLCRAGEKVEVSS